MAAGARAHRLPLGAEIALAFATGAGIFALAAVILDAVESAVVLVLVGLAYIFAVIAIARVASIAYAVPVGMAGMLAYDWYYLPPTHPLEFPDSANLVDLVVYLAVAVLLGQLAAHAARRAEAAEQARGAIADEQAALRRVATLVAEGAPARDLFAAVAAEAGNLLDVHGIRIARYEDENVLVHIAEWGKPGIDVPGYDRGKLEGTSVSAEVLRTGRAARIDNYETVTDRPTFTRGLDLKSVVGAPIVVEGRLWGVMLGWSTSAALPRELEGRLADFAELVATAISNTEARTSLARLADEQAALRRVATLVARAASPEEVFSSVAEEVGRLLEVGFTVMGRYDVDGTVTAVGMWTGSGAAMPIPDIRTRLGGENTASMVFRTGRPARIDDYNTDSGLGAAFGREWGFSSAVGVPISVEGRLWGVMTVAATRAETLPADTEARLAGFTELVATAIANTESQTQLTASRARIVAAADAARRRIERDLHDGAQQRLVSLAMQLHAAREALPPGAGGLLAQLDGMATEATSALDELRELARGIHPAALTEGGLRPALNALARRCAVPVDLDLRVDGRLPEPIEVAAYYVVAETLTNAAKHARASRVHVEADAGGDVLLVRVRDDGRGGADLAHGSGLVGIRDRVEALSGRISVRSAPGTGTCVQVELPLDGTRPQGLSGMP